MSNPISKDPDRQWGRKERMRDWGKPEDEEDDQKRIEDDRNRVKKTDNIEDIQRR